MMVPLQSPLTGHSCLMQFERMPGCRKNFILRCSLLTSILNQDVVLRLEERVLFRKILDFGKEKLPIQYDLSPVMRRSDNNRRDDSSEYYICTCVAVQFCAVLRRVTDNNLRILENCSIDSSPSLLVSFFGFLCFSSNAAPFFPTGRQAQLNEPTNGEAGAASRLTSPGTLRYPLAPRRIVDRIRPRRSPLSCEHSSLLVSVQHRDRGIAGCWFRPFRLSLSVCLHVRVSIRLAKFQERSRALTKPTIRSPRETTFNWHTKELSFFSEADNRSTKLFRQRFSPGHIYSALIRC